MTKRKQRQQQHHSTADDDDEPPIHVPWLGGPGTLLPFYVEACLAWMLAIGCLGVSGYHYIVDTFAKPYWTILQATSRAAMDSLAIIRLMCHQGLSQLLQPLSYFFFCCQATKTSISKTKAVKAAAAASSSSSSSAQQLPCWLPLTTYSRSEMDRATPTERMQQLEQILQRHHHKLQHNESQTTSTEWNDQQLIALIRGDVVLRRLASLAMRPPLLQEGEDDIIVDVSSPLRQQLIRIWPDLLRLPVENEFPDIRYPFEISLIMACFRERPSHVRAKLHHAYSMARHATSKIQVVLVDAGGNNDCDGEEDDDDEGPLHHLVNGKPCDCQWVNIKIVDFTKQQQGRGPALNAGAASADGRILAFLHSDTRLPVDWDVKLLEMFRRDDTDDNDTHPSSRVGSMSGDAGHRRRVRANAAAFGFGIDMSGLNKNTHSKVPSTTEPDAAAAAVGSDVSSYYPPGLRAVQVTANLRCRLWSLPYGDQCLCLPAIVFHHVGGYPHQCFMEDYELIALLRRRKALVHKFFHQGNDDDIMVQKKCRMAAMPPLQEEEEEVLKIIPGPPALCSPRRWQRLGVLYVTFMNSRLVNLYHARDLTPEDLYERYYGHALKGCQDLAPWEIQLLRDLQQEQ